MEDLRFNPMAVLDAVGTDPVIVLQYTQSLISLQKEPTETGNRLFAMMLTNALDVLGHIPECITIGKKTILNLVSRFSQNMLVNTYLQINGQKGKLNNVWNRMLLG